MWPSYEDMNDTPTLEWALTECYLEAFSRWLPQVLPSVLPELSGSATLPINPDAVVGSESLAVWQEQVDEIITPAVRLMWCYSYAQAAFHLRSVIMPPQPGLVADGEPAYGENTFNEPIWPPPPGNDRKPVKPVVPYVPPTPEEIARAAEIAERRYETRPRTPGPSPSPEDTFDSWLGNVRRIQETLRAHPSFAPDDVAPVSVTPDIVEILPTRSPSASFRGAPRGLPYNPRQTPDLVAELTALAWKTKPSQMKLAALMVWDEVASKRQLEMFLGSYSPKVAESIPGRVRDLLVGSTRRGARLAIPLEELKSELGVWLGSVQPKYGGTPTGPWRERIKPLRKYDPATEDWPTKPSAKSWGDFYEREFVPLSPRPAMDYFQRFRDIGREAGLETAGIINHATLIAASQSDTEFAKVWCAHMDRRTRDTHFAADGQQVAVDADFTVGGHALDYPGDPKGPPAEVRNCRCRVGMNSPDAPLPREQKRNGAQKNEITHRRRQGIVRAREDPDGIGVVPPASTALRDTESDVVVTEDHVSASAAPNEQEYAMDVQDAPAAEFRTFSDAVIAFVGSPTSDRRMLASTIELSVRTPPLPLMWMRQSQDGHASAFTVGVIESAELTDHGTVVASGYLLNSPEADEAAEQLAHGVTRPSVDLASVSWITTDRDGNEVTEDNYADGADLYMTMTSAELIGTTLVSTPAFGDTSLPLNANRETRDFAVVASAFAPRVYDHTLFDNPKLTAPTAPTMSKDGRIFGHLACFGQCHRSIQTECVMAPRSRSEYAHFHTSPAVRLDDGKYLPVGRLTVGTGHAPSNASPRVAAAHYDNTGACFALVRVGEDEHGIWFSGVAAPWATAEQVEMGLSSPLSGDWRDFGQGLELVAALAVNTPGFAIAQGQSDEQGRPVSLVASLGPVADSAVESLSLSDIRAAVKEAVTEVLSATEDEQFKAERDAELARSLRVTRPPTPDEEIAELLASRQ